MISNIPYSNLVKKTLKQKRGPVIRTKMAPYSAYGTTGRETLQKAEFKPYLWWRYIDDIFLLGNHSEEKLKSFTDNINKMQSNIKFTTDWSKRSCNRIYH